nr:MAG TPA: protein of unknown function (DUF5053) [Caudoviricetes sp.]
MCKHFLRKRTLEVLLFIDLSSTKIRQRLNFVSERLQNIDKIVSLSYIAKRYFVI